MVKYITVKLTREQANYLSNTRQLHEDLPLSHPDNAFIMRIVNKLNKALATQ